MNSNYNASVGSGDSGGWVTIEGGEGQQFTCYTEPFGSYTLALIITHNSDRFQVEMFIFNVEPGPVVYSLVHLLEGTVLRTNLLRTFRHGLGKDAVSYLVHPDDLPVEWHQTTSLAELYALVDRGYSLWFSCPVKQVIPPVSVWDVPSQAQSPFRETTSLAPMDGTVQCQVSHYTAEIHQHPVSFLIADRGIDIVRVGIVGLGDQAGSILMTSLAGLNSEFLVDSYESVTYFTPYAMDELVESCRVSMAAGYVPKSSRYLPGLPSVDLLSAVVSNSNDIRLQGEVLPDEAWAYCAPALNAQGISVSELTWLCQVMLTGQVRSFLVDSAAKKGISWLQ